MALGAIAFCVYAYAAGLVLMRYKRSAAWTTLSLLPIWLGISLGLWWTLLR